MHTFPKVKVSALKRVYLEKVLQWNVNLFIAISISNIIFVRACLTYENETDRLLFRLGLYYTFLTTGKMITSSLSNFNFDQQQALFFLEEPILKIARFTIDIKDVKTL